MDKQVSKGLRRQLLLPVEFTWEVNFDQERHKTFPIHAMRNWLIVGIVLLAFVSVLLVYRQIRSFKNDDTTLKIFSKDDDNFNGSFVEQFNSTLSCGYVCLQHNETGLHLYTYSLTGKPLALANGTPPLTIDVKEHYPWAWWPVGKKFEEWKSDRDVFYVPGKTVLLVRIYGSNVAHCMSDLIFSFAPDIPLLWNTTTEAYPKFVYVDHFAKQVSQSLMRRTPCPTHFASSHHHHYRNSSTPALHGVVKHFTKPVLLTIIPNLFTSRR